MSLPLFEHLPTVAARLASADRLLLALDYDGTLTPIVEDPAAATLARATRRLLRELSGRHKVCLAIVSGRGLDDVRRLVAVDELTYAGNHGLEIMGPGFRYVEPAAAALRPTIGALAQTLSHGVEGISGALIEDKGLTLSVHHRRVAARDQDALRAVLEQTVAAGSGELRVTQGSQVYEIRPGVAWDKGAATVWIRDCLRCDATVFIGDDATDEDAFRALPEQITIKVGASTRTAARYHVDGPPCVEKFLAWLRDMAFEAPAS